MYNNKVWTSRFTSAGGGCATVSMWVTLKGLLHTSGELAFALPLTVSSGVIAFLIFAFLCQTMPGKSPDVQSKLVLGVLMPGLAVVVATSTFMGILGMAAPEAQRRDMLKTIDQVDAHLEQLLTQLERQSEAIVFLEGKAKEFADLAEQEKETGRFERKGGNSRAYRDLSVISGQFAAATELLRADQERREQAGDTATETLSELREMAESTQANVDSLRRVSEPYTVKLRALSVALAELRRSALDGDVLAPLKTALGQLELIPFRNRSTASEEAMERQEAAATMVARLGTESHDQSAKALQAFRYEVETYERLSMRSPSEAVIEHFWAVAHLVAFPVALDLGFPLVALIALCLMHAPPRSNPELGPVGPPEEEHHETARAWTEMGRSVTASRKQRSLRSGHGT